MPPYLPRVVAPQREHRRRRFQRWGARMPRAGVVVGGKGQRRSSRSEYAGTVEKTRHAALTADGLDAGTQESLLTVMLE